MTERITRENVTERVANVNRRLESHGSSYHYEAQGRNGYIGLDRYEGESCVSNVMCGSKREVAEALHAMMVALDDAQH